MLLSESAYTVDSLWGGQHEQKKKSKHRTTNTVWLDIILEAFSCSPDEIYMYIYYSFNFRKVHELLLVQIYKKVIKKYLTGDE